MDMNNNEVLFWKVIHNKYLFKKITGSIGEVIDNILYNNCLKYGYKCYSIENRDKFKYIHSLSWMINKGQFELLKWKLQTDQYIQINIDSLKLLIEKYPLQNNIFSLLLEKKRTLIECLCNDLKSFIKENSRDINVTEYLLKQLDPSSEVTRINTTKINVHKEKEQKKEEVEEKEGPIKCINKVGTKALPLYTQYSNAIATCDINKIKELELLSENLDLYTLSESFYKLFKNNSIQQIEQLTNYWYTNEYAQFSDQTFRDFIERVIYQQRNHQGFSNIKLNLNQNNGTPFQKLVLTILIDLIKINDFKSILLFFNIHSFKLYNFEYYCLDGKGLEPKYLFDKSLNVYTNNFTCNEIIEMVNFWIGKYKTNSVSDSGGSGGDNYNTSFSFIFNHLYSTFIQIKMVKLQDILVIRKLIEDCGIEIHHSVFHSFNYLLVKSPLLVKYILGSTTILNWCYDNLNFLNTNYNLIHNQEIQSLRCKINYNFYNCYRYVSMEPLSEFELCDKFTFELVFGNNNSKTFDELLFVLLIRKNHHLFLNTDIIYLLDINRLDILFEMFNKFKFSFPNPPSEKLLKLAFKSLNSNNTITILQHYTNEIAINQWFRSCLIYENKHIIKYMFENYGILAKWDKLFSNCNLNKLNLISIEYIFSNYSSSFQPNSATDIFNSSLIKGNLELCDLLLKYYPNHFKITDTMKEINPTLSNFIKNKYNK